MTKRFILLFVSLLIVSTVSAQTYLAHTYRRIVPYVLQGWTIYPGDQALSARTGSPTRLYAGFKGSYGGVLGFDYKVHKFFYSGLNLFYNNTSKTGVYRQPGNQIFELDARYKQTPIALRLPFKVMYESTKNKYIASAFFGPTLTFYSDKVMYTQRQDSAITPGQYAGNSIQVTSVTRRQPDQRHLFKPFFGVYAGASIGYSIKPRIAIIAEYSYNVTFNKKNTKTQTEITGGSQTNLKYNFVGVGIRYKLNNYSKQLLARLKFEDFKSSEPVDIRGVIVYEDNEAYTKHPLFVEQTDTTGNNVQELLPTKRNVSFISYHLEPGDYLFVLPKKNKSIIRADIEFINSNKVDVEDDIVELEMVEEEVTDRYLTRDANFAVALREGFQHEIKVATAAENIEGEIYFENADSSAADKVIYQSCCQKVKLILRDINDSIVAVIDSANSCQFNFTGVKPGEYSLQINFAENTPAECQRIFKYKFTGATPYIKKQYITTEPFEDIGHYQYKGSVKGTNNKGVMGTDVMLINENGRVIRHQKSSALGSFDFQNAGKGSYSVAFNDKPGQVLSYNIKNDEDQTKSSKLYKPTKSAAAKETDKKLRIVGKITKSDSISPVSKPVQVYLIDENGGIKGVTTTNSKGEYKFVGYKEGKYKIAYEAPKEVKSVVLYTNMSEYKVKKAPSQEYSQDFEYVDTLFNISGTTDGQHKVRKVEAKEFEQGTTYTPTGYIVYPEGYGVITFRSSDYEQIEKQVAILHSKSLYELYIKAKPTDTGAKEYIIVVGAYNSTYTAESTKQKLIKLGYKNTEVTEH